MRAWLLRRIAAGIAIVFATVSLSFVAIHLAPGRPFLPADERPMNPAVLARLQRMYGLDQPIPVQYVRYLAALARGEMGESFSQRRPVAQAIADAVPNTLLLATSALAIDFTLGILIGLLQAARARRRSDVALGNVTLFFYSLPIFWLALVLQLVFGLRLGWFPIGGVNDPALYASLPFLGQLADRLHHLVLPALTLGIVGAGGTARFQRASLLEALGQEYVRTARAKGLAEPAVLIRHAWRDALLPVIALSGVALPFLLTGAVLIESVFAWPGLGKLAADAIGARDYPLVLGTTLLATSAVVLGSLVADVLTAVADPRVRLTA
ncbi:MAG TPA: ABC transporter permease [Gemmatimonadales bacterium]|nr:ABC transporter permease [Gemmatimonadales bacterium]